MRHTNPRAVIATQCINAVRLARDPARFQQARDDTHVTAAAPGVRSSAIPPHAGLGSANASAAWSSHAQKKPDGTGVFEATQADSSLAILSIHARKSHCRTYSRRPRRKHLGPRPCARSKSRVDGGKSAYRDTSSQDKTGLPIRSARRCTRSSERALPAVDITVVAPAAPLSSVRWSFAVMTRSIP